MDNKEDGEISEEEVYQPIERPTAPIYRNAQPMALTDDESSDDDSDNEWKQEKKRMRLARIPQQTVPLGQKNGIKKRNNIWANVIQEDELTQVIGGVGLKRKLPSDRNVESYDYSLSKSNSNPFSVLDSGDENGDNFDMDKDTEEGAQKREGRKQRFHVDMDHSGNNVEGLRRKRVLEDIKVESDWTNEDVGSALAEALFEPKKDLMVRVVDVLGRKKAMQMYEETKKLEIDGGMLIMNGARRRTSGGVFLHILKYKSLVSKEQSDSIFMFGGEANQEDRKRKRNDKRRRKRKREGTDVSQSKSLEKVIDEGFNLGGLFTDDPNGTKCPGSTPVESIQNSDDEERSLSPMSRQRVNSTALPIPFKEVCEKAALQIVERDHSGLEIDSSSLSKNVENPDEMDVA